MRVKEDSKGQELLRIFNNICKDNEIEHIKNVALERYNSLNYDMSWHDASIDLLTAIRHRLLRCIYLSVADWLHETKSSLIHNNELITPFKIQKPGTIKKTHQATKFDLALLLSAVARLTGFHVLLIELQNDRYDNPFVGIAPGGNRSELINSENLMSLLCRPENGIIILNPETLLLQMDDENNHYTRALKSFDPQKVDRFIDFNQSPPSEDMELVKLLGQAVFQVLTTRGECNGTGFFVTGAGYALTCWHCLFVKNRNDETPIFDKDAHFKIRFHGVKFDAKLLKEKCYEKEDIAVVFVDAKQKEFPEFKPLPLTKWYLPGTEVYCYGFKGPHVYIDGDNYPGMIRTDRPRANIRFEDGNIQDVLLIVGACYGPGLSGSPVACVTSQCVFGIETGRHGGWEYNVDGQRIDFSETGFVIPIEKVYQRWNKCPISTNIAPNFVLI